MKTLLLIGPLKRQQRPLFFFLAQSQELNNKRIRLHPWRSAEPVTTSPKKVFKKSALLTNNRQTSVSLSGWHCSTFTGLTFETIMMCHVNLFGEMEKKRHQFLTEQLVLCRKVSLIYCSLLFYTQTQAAALYHP